MLFLKKPILLYCMGKCASTTVSEKLKILNYDVFHIHQICHINHRLDLNFLLKKSLVISMTRELIGRNISWFFQRMNINNVSYSECYVGNEDQVLNMSIDDLKHHFYYKLPSKVHFDSLNWFDENFKKNLNFDVYDYNFNIEKGFSVYDDRILIIRFEDMKRVGEKAIADFIKLDNFNFVEDKNVGFKKWYREKYIAFLKEPVPEWYVNMMYETKFMRHFYSKEEILFFKKKYLNISNLYLN